MAMSSNNPVKPLVDASEITSQASKPMSKSLNKKPVIIVVVGVLLLMTIVFGIYYFFVYRDNVDQTEEVNASVFIPDEDEIDYLNEKYNFKMIVKRDWNINEFGTKVEFNVGNDGKIYFEAFEIVSLQILAKLMRDSVSLSRKGLKKVYLEMNLPIISISNYLNRTD